MRRQLEDISWKGWSESNGGTIGIGGGIGSIRANKDIYRNESFFDHLVGAVDRTSRTKR